MPVIKITDDAHWHALRKLHGGSSEVGALFNRGYSDLASKWSLWALKSGVLDLGPSDDEPRLRIAKATEPAFADEIARRTGWDLFESPAADIHGRVYVTHPNAGFKMGCTVDRYVREHEDGPGIIELKKRDWLEWRDDYTDDDASIRDQMQLAHQLACHPEITWGAIAVWVGAWDFHVYPYKRKDLEPMIADIEAAWLDLWQRVANANEPALTGDDLPNWLRAHDDTVATRKAALIVHDEPTFQRQGLGEKTPSGWTFDMIAEEYREADERAKHYEKAAKAAKALIVQHMNEHGRAISNRYDVTLKATHVDGQIVRLPAPMIALLDELADICPEEKDQKALREIAAWFHEVKRPHVRTTLTVKDRDETSPLPGRSGPPASEAELAAAAKAQAPLDA